MSKCAEPGTFELEVLIEENEDFGTAFEKTRSRVLKALLAEIKERFGYSPEVCKTRLLEEFFCENTIDWASDVLGAKKSGLDWKRPHTSGAVSYTHLDVYKRQVLLMKFIKMITLLVLNYNDYENVVSFISAVYNFELFQYIVVVDNCSTDNSFEAIQFYINQKRINQKVHLIKTNKNGGYGFGNNIGLKYAINILKSQYIVVSNPDVEFEEEIILKLKKNLEENREFGVAAAAMYLSLIHI